MPSVCFQYQHSTFFNEYLLPRFTHKTSVAQAFRDNFQKQARSADLVLNTAGLEYIPIDFHVPILDVKNLPDLSPRRMLANAVIQGSFDNNRRDYTNILSELNASVHGEYLSERHFSKPDLDYVSSRP